jgi:thiol-disulfide isomerase/thioredoxin
MTDLPTSNEEVEHPGSSGLPRWATLGSGLLAVVALLGFLTITSTSDDAPGALDEFTFQTTDGGTTTLADFEGTPLVVNYFATWCAACRAELPDFEKVSNETAGEIVFVGVSRDNVTESWRSLVEDSGITYTTVFEGNIDGSFAFLEANAMPTTAFIAADGTVERVWSGALTDDKLRELIAEHLT